MRILAAAFVAFVLISLGPARGHWKPGAHNQEHAITHAFCGGTFKPCKWGEQAKVVAALESSGCVPRSCTHRDLYRQGRCSVAGNGQYQGCFQMGSSERARYGDRPGPWNQARAAFKYFRDSGWDWSPWSCKPWGGVQAVSGDHHMERPLSDKEWALYKLSDEQQRETTASQASVSGWMAWNVKASYYNSLDQGGKFTTLASGLSFKKAAEMVNDLRMHHADVAWAYCEKADTREPRSSGDSKKP